MTVSRYAQKRVTWYARKMPDNTQQTALLNQMRIFITTGQYDDETPHNLWCMIHVSSVDKIEQFYPVER